MIEKVAPCDVVVYCAEPVVRLGLEALVAGLGSCVRRRLSAPPPDHDGVRAEVARCRDAGVPVIAIVVVGSAADEAFSLVRNLVTDYAEIGVLILARDDDHELVQRAVASGARGFLLLDVDPPELERAITAIAAGYAPMDPRAARWLIQRPTLDPLEQLTARQREVLRLVASGCPNRVVAVRLGIAERTVKAHLSQIYELLGVADRTQAAIWLRHHDGTTAFPQPA